MALSKEEQSDLVKRVVAECHEAHVRERNAVIMALGNSVVPEEFLTSLQSSYITNLKWSVELSQKGFPEDKRRTFVQYLRDLANVIEQLELANKEKGV